MTTDLTTTAPAPARTRPEDRPPVLPPAPSRWLFALGLAVVVLLAAALRLPELGAGLPAVAPDEPTVVDRAIGALDGDPMPPQFDWPPGSSYVMAAALLAGRVIGIDPTGDQAELYRFGRVLFAGIALIAVALTGVLGARLADDRRRRTWTGLGAAAALALSYVSVRLSRTVHPEHLQIVFVLAALAAGLRFDADRRMRWLVASGVLAGLAGATKYLGVTVALVPLMAAVVVAGVAWRHRLRHAGVLTAAVLAGFVGGTLGTVLRGGAFLDGFAYQLGHQAGGHLGYQATTPGWVFHLGTTLPGSWGWPLTVAAIAGLVLMLARGTRAQRLTAVYAVAVFVLIGASRVAFPHYALLVMPLFAIAAFIALGRLADVLPRLGRPVLAALVLLALVPPLLNAVRLLRIADAPDTRALAAQVVADLPGPVWAEAYTGIPAADRQVFSLGEENDLAGCDCFAVVSSYQEERYTARPDLYPSQSQAYAALRRDTTIARVVAPSVPLTYRWDGLPQWGLARLPLTGPDPTVGPTITVFDLRDDA